MTWFINVKLIKTWVTFRTLIGGFRNVGRAFGGLAWLWEQIQVLVHTNVAFRRCIRVTFGKMSLVMWRFLLEHAVTNENL